MKQASVFFFTLFFYLAPCFGQALTSRSHNFTLDLPNGYQLVESNQKDRFLFKNTLVPCQLQVSYDSISTFENTAKACESIFTQLVAQHKDIPFFWCEHEAQLSTFTFMQAVEYTGWMLVLKLKDCWLSVIAYSETSMANICEPIIISSLDSIFTGPLSFYLPGPVTTCLYQRDNHFEEVSIMFDRQPLTFYMHPIDAEANKSVVEREFSVLTLSTQTGSILQAWQRYYRTIFRDSWARLQSFAFEIKNALLKKGILQDKSAVLKVLAEHVQHFSYIRIPDGTDFVDLVTACTTNTGDCDTRCLLLNIVLSQLGIKNALFISPEFGHALCGVDIPLSGAQMSDGKTNYLLVETTAKVEPGLIASDIADERKWFVTNLYGLLNQ